MPPTIAPVRPLRPTPIDVIWTAVTCTISWTRPCFAGFGRGALVINKSALRARFSRLEICVARIRTALSDLSAEQYLADWYAQDVTARNLQIASQILLDVGSYIIAEMGWESPRDYEDVMLILARHGVMAQDLARRLRGMA